MGLLDQELSISIVHCSNTSCPHVEILPRKVNTDDCRKDAILSQKVYGECGIIPNTCKLHKHEESFSADHPEHHMLFRKHVSRNAASKGRAVLEGVGLDSATIEACFKNSPHDEEEAVQDGLNKWAEGKGSQPPTWDVLLGAMQYAQIVQLYVNHLMEKLGKLIAVACVRIVCVCVLCVLHIRYVTI